MGIRAVVRFAAILGAAGLVSLPLAAAALEGPAYSPVQTEDELRFVAETLGQRDRIAALQASSGHAPHIAYALLDLDADGRGEVFIRLFPGESCERGDCTTLVFSLSQGRWMAVLETREPEVSVAKQMHRGYRDILVGSQPWLWTGRAYAPMR